MKKILPIAAALALGGCTLAPKYERPPAPVSSEWPTQSAATNSAPATDIHWSEFFDDPRLRALIGLSLTNNRDLRIATFRVEEARALYRIRRDALLPTVDGGASAVRRRTSRTIAFADETTATTTYEVSVNASYELDLFGRIRSLKKEALERYFAFEENRTAAQMALISEVAAQYFRLLQMQLSLELARDTLEAVQGSYELNKRSFEAGVASELDLRTAEAQVQTALVSIANFEQLLAESENALILLIGHPLPADLPPRRPLHEQKLASDLPADLPSDLLERRPDILAAEHILKASNANIGAARALFFPRIFLTGSGGTVSAKLSDLFTGPSAAWSFAPQMTVPIFQGGQALANLEVAKLGRDIEIAGYERAIQIAFREVADALAVRRIVDAKLSAQGLLVEAQQKRYDLTNARYRQGVDSYVTVLLAQQDLFEAQRNFLQFQAARLINAVTLYRSLGGGWRS